MVTETTFWYVVGAGAFVALTISGAVYSNRRKLAMMWQRLFGLPGDPSDKGHIKEMEQSIRSVDDRLTRVEGALGEVRETVEDVQVSMKENQEETRGRLESIEACVNEVSD